MRHSSWVKLLNHVPPDHHNALIVVTRSRVEIAVQTILRVDYEFFVVKGRLSGSQDVGRIYILAYDNLDHIGYNREVRDEEFQATFDTLVLDAPDADAAPAARAVPAAAPPEEPPEPRDPLKPASLGRIPIKSEVLERFRARGNGPAES